MAQRPPAGKEPPAARVRKLVLAVAVLKQELGVGVTEAPRPAVASGVPAASAPSAVSVAAAALARSAASAAAASAAAVSAAAVSAAVASAASAGRAGSAPLVALAAA